MGRGCYLEHGEEGDNKTVKIGLRGPVREVKCSAKQLKQKDICSIVVGEKGAREDSGVQSKKGRSQQPFRDTVRRSHSLIERKIVSFSTF